MRTNQLIIFSIISFSIFSCKQKIVEESEALNDTIPVKVFNITKQKTHEEVEAAGQFTTEDETILSFKTGGVIQHILVKEGDKVRAGQLLATLDLTEIQAQVEQAKIVLEKAERDNKRAENLYKDSVATLEQVQNSRTALAVAQQQLHAAKFNENFSGIRAIKDGYILRKFANDGQIVGPGIPVLQIYGSNVHWVLKVTVSEKNWKNIKTGDKAKIMIDGSETDTMNAIVKSRSEGVDPVTGTMWVNVSPNTNIKSNIAAGAFGKAIISPSTYTDAWYIPYDALLDGNGNEGYVFITSDNQKAEKIKVKIIRIEHDNVLVGAGLENATGVIISGNAYLANGSAIKVIQ